MYIRGRRRVQRRFFIKNRTKASEKNRGKNGPDMRGEFERLQRDADRIRARRREIEAGAEETLDDLVEGARLRNLQGRFDHFMSAPEATEIQLTPDAQFELRAEDFPPLINGVRDESISITTFFSPHVAPKNIKEEMGDAVEYQTGVNVTGYGSMYFSQGDIPFLSMRFRAFKVIEITVYHVNIPTAKDLLEAWRGNPTIPGYKAILAELEKRMIT